MCVHVLLCPGELVKPSLCLRHVWNFPSSVKNVKRPHVGYLVICGWEGRKLSACLTLKKSCRLSMSVTIHLRLHCLQFLF